MDQITNLLYTDYFDYIYEKPEETYVHKGEKTIFSILTDYFKQLTKLGMPITWAPVESEADKSIKNKIIVTHFLLVSIYV